MRISILSHLGQQASHLVCRFRAPGPRQPRRKPRPHNDSTRPWLLDPQLALRVWVTSRVSARQVHADTVMPCRDTSRSISLHTLALTRIVQGSRGSVSTSSQARPPNDSTCNPSKPDSASPAHRLTISSLIKHHCRQQTHSSRPPHLSQKPFRQPIRVNHQYGPVSATNKHHLDYPPRTIKSDRGPPHRLNILITPTHPSRPRRKRPTSVKTPQIIGLDTFGPFNFNTAHTNTETLHTAIKQHIQTTLETAPCH